MQSQSDAGGGLSARLKVAAQSFRHFCGRCSKTEMSNIIAVLIHEIEKGRVIYAIAGLPILVFILKFRKSHVIGLGRCCDRLWRPRQTSKTWSEILDIGSYGLGRITFRV